jgi:mRNA export factor
VKLYDVQSSAQTQIGLHDSPIRTVRFVDVPNANSMLVTGSWDKTIRYWDVRQQQSVATVHLPERVYSMDVQQQLLVIGLAERHVCIVNLSNPTVLYKSIQSPLKWQTRVVSCFPNATGFAIGSTEGRCAIQYVEEKDTRYTQDVILYIFGLYD